MSSALCLKGSCYCVKCPDTSMSLLSTLSLCVSSYYCIRCHTTMCPHTTIYVSSYYYVSSYEYKCAHTSTVVQCAPSSTRLSAMCHLTTIYVGWYCVQGCGRDHSGVWHHKSRLLPPRRRLDARNTGIKFACFTRLVKKVQKYKYWCEFGVKIRYSIHLLY